MITLPPIPQDRIEENVRWRSWLNLVGTILQTPGLSVTITTAKLTAGGTNGSMTFTNGILTASTPAT